MDLNIVNSLKGQLNSVLHHGIKRFNVNGNVTTVAISLLIGYLSYLLVYGLFFCPTRHIPGPVLTRFGQAYWRYILMAGSVSTEIHRLHLKYGFSLPPQSLLISRFGGAPFSYKYRCPTPRSLPRCMERPQPQENSLGQRPLVSTTPPPTNERCR